jgi:hypothetical protein
MLATIPESCISPFYICNMYELNVQNYRCPTRYRTRHFCSNSNTNEDIATKFEQEYVLYFHISYTMR